MKKIKWGVLGTAGIAKEQTIPGMKEADNCELYAIAGRNIEKAKEFPQYGFEKHKGYGTKLHYEKIREFGPSPIHRMSFLKKLYGEK